MDALKWGRALESPRGGACYLRPTATEWRNWSVIPPALGRPLSRSAREPPLGCVRGASKIALRPYTEGLMGRSGGAIPLAGTRYGTVINDREPFVAAVFVALQLPKCAVWLISRST